MPKISVIVPVYNVEKYIRRCLTSIQQQSLSDIEIVIVNDGTPDDSMAIVRELAQLDDRIKILEHEKNMGLMWTRRTGYLAATGDYITFCDSDDYLPQDALESLYKKAIETGADIVSGNYTYVTASGKKVLKRNKLPYGNKPLDVYKALLCHDMQHSLWGKLFKRSLLHDNDYQSYEHATNGEDGCLLYQIVKHVNEVVQIDKSVYYYVQNSESSSQRRYDENAVRSMCLSLATKVEMTSQYPQLHSILDKHITNYLCELIAKGYGNDVNLNKYIHQYGLERYLSVSKIIKDMNYIKILKTVLSRIVCRDICKR